MSIKILHNSEGALNLRNISNNGETARKWLMGLVVSSLLAGCASSGSQPDNAIATEQTVVANQAEQPQSKEEKQADAMMASLAKKSKFDEPEAETVAAEEPKAKEKMSTASTKVVSESAPKKKAAVKPKPVAKADAAPEKVETKTVPVKKRVSNAKPLNATINDLPIDYDIWKIRKGETSLDGDLVISTPTWEMGEPGYMSQIWITLMDDKLLVSSSSDIFAPEGAAGIKLDSGALIPFDEIAEGNIGVLQGDQWLDKLADSNQLKVLMGFFPDRVPQSDVYESVLDLDKLARVVATYKQLNQ